MYKISTAYYLISLPKLEILDSSMARSNDSAIRHACMTVTSERYDSISKKNLIVSRQSE